ncbi:MAG: electron transfer flavoprotein subunit alpha [Dehalococcoidia bacterium]|nr:electron transfer flavoprotein subunit alpha [Dehalococcoidia bacterium]
MIPSAYGAEDARGVWIFLEQRDGELAGVGRELLGKGRELADAGGVLLTGVLLGHRVKDAAAEAAALGADEVLLASHHLLADYSTTGYTAVLDQLVRERRPEALLIGATANGRDLAGRLAVRLRTGLTADCTDLELDPETGLHVGRVAGFGGGIEALITCPQHRPQMATVRPGVFATPEPGGPQRGRITDVPVVLGPEDISVEVVDRVTRTGVDLTRAPALVIGGSGTHGDFQLLEELADLIGAELGASRVAVDEGWISREHQIGQTGTVTRPELAIVCGVSGASQFTVGIEEAKTVVAINTDPEAPIFEAADYCVVDNLFNVLPPLIAAIRQDQGAGQ